MIKQLCGLCLLPLCAAATVTMARLIGAVRVRQAEQWWFITGGVVYGVFHLARLRPAAAYVFGHEATHALAVWLCGGAVRSFRAGADGGAVAATKHNLFIGLAPYLAPLYAVLVSVAFSSATWVWPAARRFTAGYLFVLGLLLSVHALMTAQTLAIRQSDIRQQGALFALPLIYLVNALVVCGIIVAVFRPLPALDVAAMAAADAARVATVLGRWAGRVPELFAP